MVTELTKDGEGDWQLDAPAEAARRDWQKLVAAVRASGRRLNEYLADELRDTLGGRNLLAIDMDRDLAACADIDSVNVLPEVDVRQWRIRKA